ncbi:hypothetical protein EUGRSUZ_L01752 [Eucalyptus grandis]|uniref:Uncharacterized protein n=1 Tax=Eucalyptus grandis TaxID=71139 RepID=A0A058ZUH5_EUCGR|nr:hypothetical protein EUGRSUZ_L01752 [Eucalyptus grandis]
MWKSYSATSTQVHSTNDKPLSPSHVLFLMPVWFTFHVPGGGIHRRECFLFPPNSICFFQVKTDAEEDKLCSHATSGKG